MWCVPALICQVLLSSTSTTPPLELKGQLAYSMVWSMGGHLSSQNKLAFNQWWRDTFTEPGLAVPDSGTIWDYYLDVNTASFLPCHSDTTPLLSSSECTTGSQPPFVSTGKAAAVAHLIRQLIKGGCPVLLGGDPGSGKTALIQQVLSGNNSDMSFQHVYASQVYSITLYIWIHVNTYMYM